MIYEWLAIEIMILLIASNNLSHLNQDQHDVQSRWVVAIIHHLFDVIYQTNTRTKSTFRRAQASENDESSGFTRLARMKLTCTT